MGKNNGWVRVSNFQELREKLTPEPEKVVHDFLPKRPPRQARQAPEPVERSSARMGSERKREPLDRDTDLKQLDATVHGLTARIEVGLAHVVGGGAVWNKIKEDKYDLNPARRAALPKKVVGWLSDLQKTKQRYILLREVKRYKGLLQSLPGWDIRRVARKIEAAQQKRVVAIPQKPKPVFSRPVTGIEGYSGRDIAKKRYWFNEE